MVIFCMYHVCREFALEAHKLQDNKNDHYVQSLMASLSRLLIYICMRYYFVHHNFLRTIRIIYNILKMPVFYSQY